MTSLKYGIPPINQKWNTYFNEVIEIWDLTKQPNIAQSLESGETCDPTRQPNTEHSHDVIEITRQPVGR